MFRLSCRVATILLLLGLMLVVPWPAEAADGTGAAWIQPWDLADRIWETLVGLWNQNGCSLDPSGRCAGSLAGSAAEEGCSLDPDGRRTCGPGGSGTASLNNGCSVDPNGVCRK